MIRLFSSRRTEEIRAEIPKKYHHLLAGILDAAAELSSESDAKLREFANTFREQVEHNLAFEDLELITGMSLCFEALRRARNVSLFDVQILASLVLVNGGIVVSQ